MDDDREGGLIRFDEVDKGFKVWSSFVYQDGYKKSSMNRLLRRLLLVDGKGDADTDFGALCAATTVRTASAREDEEVVESEFRIRASSAVLAVLLCQGWLRVQGDACFVREHGTPGLLRIPGGMEYNQN